MATLGARHATYTEGQMPLHYGDGMDATLNLGVGALFICDASNSGGIFGRNL